MADHAMCSFLSLTGTFLLVRDIDKWPPDGLEYFFVVAIRPITVIYYSHYLSKVGNIGSNFAI